MKAKHVSLGGKIFGVVFIATLTVLNGVFRWQIPNEQIIRAGVVCVLITAPIDVSVWMDKVISGGKNGNGNS